MTKKQRRKSVVAKLLGNEKKALSTLDAHFTSELTKHFEEGWRIEMTYAVQVPYSYSEHGADSYGLSQSMATSTRYGFYTMTVFVLEREKRG